MTVAMEARNATLDDLATLLKEQHARKFDVVAPSSQIHSKDATLVIKGAEPILGDDGVTSADGRYVPTAVFDEGIADKLGVPLAYVRRLRAERPDLYDANVNGWLKGRRKALADGSVETVHAPDPRKFLIRCFRGDDGDGIARAFLSDRFKIVDNLDVLTAALDGIREAGVNVEIDSCDLTERKMQVKVVAPEVMALAPVLMAGYRNPFADPAVERALNHGWDIERAREAARREGMGYDPGSEPVVFAGFVIGNSETGGGRFTLVPRLVVKVCRNGLTITKDAIGSVHLGSKMGEGVIQWSDDTQQKNVALVKAQSRDAVNTFLDVEYMKGVIERIEEQAGATVTKPNDAIETIGKTLKFGQETIDGVLDHFIRGGQMTAGGVLNAVTSYAQTVQDADAASEIEANALRALELASA